MSPAFVCWPAHLPLIPRVCGNFPKDLPHKNVISCPRSFSHALTWLPPALLPLPGTSPYIWYLHWHLCHQRWFQKEFCSLQSSDKLQNMSMQWPGVKKYIDNTESPIWGKIFEKETWRNLDFYFFSTVALHSITMHFHRTPNQMGNKARW